MATDRQIEANRKNAEKCTGPRTETGKANSSQNALKTGLDAKSEVLRFESRPDYEALIAELYARFQPAVPEDRALVDMLVCSEWLARRYVSIDTSIWEHDFYRTSETSLGATFLRSQQALDRVGRRINSAQRNYQRALKQLLEIREKRAVRGNEIGPADTKPDHQPEPEPAAPETAPVTPETNIETEPLNPELVSFLPSPPNQPEIPENTPTPNPSPEENPPTAA